MLQKFQSPFNGFPTASSIAAVAESTADAETAQQAAEAAAANAAASETAAANSAAASATNFDAPLWVSGEAITAGDKRRSPIDGNVYKALNDLTTGENTTDPSADSTNWRATFLDFVTGYGDTEWQWFSFADSKSVAPEIEMSRPGQGSIFTAAGNYEEAYANQPLITHNPETGECRGLYSGLEFTEHQHNPLSVDTDTADFSGINVTKAGTLSQRGLFFHGYTADAVNAGHVVQGQQSRPSGAGTWIAYAVLDMRSFNKASLRPVRLNDGDVNRTASPVLVFDKTNLTFSGQATIPGEVDSYGYFPLREDTYMLWCEFSSDASTTAIYSQVLFIDPITGGSSYTGDGTTELYIAALGIREGGAKPPMLIPGGDAPTTVLADIAKITGANLSDMYDQSGGTFLIGFNYGGGPEVRKHILSLALDGSNYVRLSAYGVDRLDFEIRASGIGQTLFERTISDWVVGQDYLIAFRIEKDNSAIAFQDLFVKDETGGTIPPVNSLYFFRNFLNTDVSIGSGAMKYLGYTTQHLSDADMKRLVGA